MVTTETCFECDIYRKEIDVPSLCLTCGRVSVWFGKRLTQQEMDKLEQLREDYKDVICRDRPKPLIDEAVFSLKKL